jgi:glycine/D-amino acid oxidase-like deaminating enzyme/nitrite reductase/ring-hydroxylating ferredoxin subunit
MNTISYWRDSESLPRFRALDTDLDVDVVVVGAGLTGVTTAYLLKKTGATVALLERDHCGGVDTSYTTAHLTNVTDARLSDLVSRFGREQAQLVWEGGGAALDQIYANIQAEEIDCDFAWLPGYLHLPLDGESRKSSALKRDAELAREFGFAAEFVGSVPYLAPPGVWFPNQARFHPLKYLRGLLRAIPGNGSHVFERSEVSEFTEKPMAVVARGHRVKCRYVVLATHTPLTGHASFASATMLQTKLYLYTSYALGAKVRRDLLPEALFWDTGEPYNYLRVDRRRGFDYAIFGGEDHKTGQEPHTTAPYKRLEEKLLALIPSATIVHRWSGQVVETNDGLPFIGETAERQFAATGFGGNGMTFGTLSAMMAVDAWRKRANPWTKLFSPGRTHLRGGTWHYLTENKDYPYYLVRNWAAGSGGKSLKSLKRNQGKILNLEGKKVAAYRDPHGHVTLCSPVCTHLKCIVGWNEAEQTWDCPCHGSRFKATGEVMSGPAEKDLEKIETSANGRRVKQASANERNLCTPFIP